MQIFLDCDGVLADFKKGATKVLGMDPTKYEEKHGKKEFWKQIYAAPNFFYNLEPMSDAHDLVNAVKHLKPTILTGRPAGTWGTQQKLDWGKKYFPDLPMIVCLAKDKNTYGKAGDILIDDTVKYEHLWAQMGGIWITHTSARNTIAKLKKMKVI